MDLADITAGFPMPDVKIGDTMYVVRHEYENIITSAPYEYGFAHNTVVEPVVIGNGIVASASYDKREGWSYSVMGKQAFTNREDAVVRANEAVAAERKHIRDAVKEKQDEIRQMLSIYGKIRHKEVV